jgi:hypothetical protein
MVSEPSTFEVTVEQETAATFMERPHVVLLGAGASRAALPEGDRRGRPVPLLRDVADDLGLAQHFPEELRELAASNFEAAYSQLHDRAPTRCGPIDDAVRAHFAQLELPDEPNLYDVLTLSLRSTGHPARSAHGCHPYHVLSYLAHGESDLGSTRR